MTRRDRTILIVVGVLAAVAAAWMLVIQPRRQQAGKLGKQVAAMQSQLDSTRSQVAQAISARSAYQREYAALARLGEAVPSDDNVPSLIYQLQSAAQDSRVDFRSLQVSGSASAAAPAPATATSASGAAQLPPGATVGPAGFPIEPFTFEFRGNFFHLADFFGRVQHFVVAGSQGIVVRGRLLTLNAISLTPAPQGFPMIRATISATAYLLPPSQGGASAPSSGGSSAAGKVASTSSPSTAAAPAAALPPTIR